MVMDRREVCKHVRKSVYSPRPSYGHLLTERMTHGDFQGCAALSLILESASRHSLKKLILILFYKDRVATGRPPQGLFKVAVLPPHKEDSASYRNVIVKLVTTGRTANSFVTQMKDLCLAACDLVTANWTHAINQPHRGLCHILCDHSSFKINVSVARRFCPDLIFHPLKRLLQIRCFS